MSVKRAMPLQLRARLTLRAARTIHSYCPGLIWATVARALLTALQPLVQLFLSAQVLGGVAAGELRRAVCFALAAVAANFLLSALLGFVSSLYRERENQMWCCFGKLFTDKQLSMDYADLEDAAVQGRRTAEKEALFLFGNGLGQFVWSLSGLIEGAVGSTAAAGLSAQLFLSGGGVLGSPLWALPVLLLLTVGAVVNAKAFRKESAIFERWCERSVALNRLFVFFGWTLCTAPERAKDVRIYRQDCTAQTMLEELSRRERSDKRQIFQMSACGAWGELAIGLCQSCIYLFVVLKAFFGAFGVGSVVQYVGALGRLGHGIGKLLLGLADNAVYVGHLEHLFEFLDRPNHAYQGTLPVEKRDDNEYEFEFHSVSFRYPGSEEYALREVSLKFRVGQRLAVVGRNGSGKTTLVKLLCRLYDPTEGEITLNGIDIRKYDYDECLGLFSVVFQDFGLLSLPLGENVAAGTPYDRERAADCLQKAGFGERLSELPRGLDTCLYRDFEPDGIELSGGEAQKVALARALYREAPFLVLDEPTAALDPEAEAEVYRDFGRIAGDRTALYISHRLSSCRFCDEIAVFDVGRIAEQGSHVQLLAEGEIYAALWHAQAQYYKR